MTSTGEASRPDRKRYDRETIEFNRVVNLSDALFAIALTLRPGSQPLVTIDGDIRHADWIVPATEG